MRPIGVLSGWPASDSHWCPSRKAEQEGQVVRQRDVMEVRNANDIDGGQTTVIFAASLLTLVLTGRGFSKQRRTKRVALFAGLPGLGLWAASTRSRRKITLFTPLSWRRKSEITSLRFSPLPHGLVPLRMRTQRIRRLKLCRLLDLGPRVFTRCRDACQDVKCVPMNSL
jgi:hypothetical protein